MEQITLYPPERLDSQAKTVVKKRNQFALITAIWAVLTIAVCIFQSRETRKICSIVNGALSTVYFSYLLYFYSYDFKKEKQFYDFLLKLQTGKPETVTGIISGCTVKKSATDVIYNFSFHFDDEDKRNMVCYLSSRSGYDPKPLESAHVALQLYQNNIVGIEVLK